MNEPLRRTTKCFVPILSPASSVSVPTTKDSTSGWKKFPWAGRVCGAMEDYLLDCDLANVDRLERKEERRGKKEKRRKK